MGEVCEDRPYGIGPIDAGEATVAGIEDEDVDPRKTGVEFGG